MTALGRGAGNCRMWMRISLLHNPRYDLLPVLRCAHDTVESMRLEPLWGFDLAYRITGSLNQHPRSAIKLKQAGIRGNIRDFYNEIWE
ncbi:MAG TPA: hypothetical protein P5205_10745 [Candidatus Paceibacterota bacterium]|nr:hypothetical protein [Verrucomicrobiota bacterium]HSA10834.1 hypothetical protein [Candidatus Paceibacterota bacterium]